MKNGYEYVNKIKKKDMDRYVNNNMNMQKKPTCRDRANFPAWMILIKTTPWDGMLECVTRFKSGNERARRPATLQAFFFPCPPVASQPPSLSTSFTGAAAGGGRRTVRFLCSSPLSSARSFVSTFKRSVARREALRFARSKFKSLR